VSPPCSFRFVGLGLLLTANVAIVAEQMSASKNKPFSLTHSLVGLVLCIAHMAVALDVQPASERGLYKLTVAYLSKS